jgi:hypothetical protein
LRCGAGRDCGSQAMANQDLRSIKRNIDFFLKTIACSAGTDADEIAILINKFGAQKRSKVLDEIFANSITGSLKP